MARPTVVAPISAPTTSPFTPPRGLGGHGSLGHHRAGMTAGATGTGATTGGTGTGTGNGAKCGGSTGSATGALEESSIAERASSFASFSACTLRIHASSSATSEGSAETTFAVDTSSFFAGASELC